MVDQAPYPRAVAVGLVAGVFLAAAVRVLVWHPRTTMDQEGIEAAESEVLATGHPSVYVGHDVDGFALNDYDLGPGEATFLYGECRGDAEDACLVWDVEVHTDWDDATLAGDPIAGCSRLEPIAGVPTVRLHNEELGIDEIDLFTGHSRVTLVFAPNILPSTWRTAIGSSLRASGSGTHKRRNAAPSSLGVCACLGWRLARSDAAPAGAGP